jgi:hypothetical protein
MLYFLFSSTTHAFSVARRPLAVKPDGDHITFSCGKRTIHLYLNKDRSIIGQSVVKKIGGESYFEARMSYGDFPPPDLPLAP